ncbi:MAG: cytochrome c maturation protein CcmE [Pseudomonadota bacterium]|nr:cytochrome c maturation protein CcmE [Pseudomonadota bacterium]
MITLTSTHKKRLGMVLLIVIGVSTAVALALAAFSENMLYYFSPSEIRAGKAPQERMIRVGGMVREGSVQRAKDSLKIQFEVTDYAHTIPIQYTGILPDLFREGQGVVTIGRMQADGRFLATEVLAKHDENYMPPEVADSLKAAEVTTSGDNAKVN